MAHLLLPAAGVGAGSFGAGTVVVSGSNLSQVLLADLDNDQDLDLVSVLNGSVGYARNNGTGTMSGGAPFNLTNGVGDVVLADFDNDGDLDVLAPDGSTGVRFQRNNGAGVFTNTFTNVIDATYDVANVVLADVDTDGDLDLVGSSPGNSGVVLCLNNGTGTFGAGTLLPGGITPLAVAVADVDHDGDLDLLAADQDNSAVLIWANTGAGTFAAPTSVAVGNTPLALEVADLTGDGYPDLLTLDTSDQTLSICRGTAAGTFAARRTVALATYTTALALGDFNGDGALDLASVSQTINAVSIRFNAVQPLLDLVVSTPLNVAGGAYHNVTVTGSGTATLLGPLSATNAMLVQAGGTLDTQCQLLTGAASFTLEAGATLGICDAAGISSSGSTGAVQVGGLRSFSPDATYNYNGPAAQVTGPGLPAQVRNLGVNNRGTGLTLTQGVAVAQVLGLLAGDLRTSGRPLTLRSSALGTALVDNTGGVVQGTATVERWIDPTANPGPGYRHLAAPIGSATVASLATARFVPTLNAAYNRSAGPGLVAPFPTVYGYDQSLLATSPATAYGYFDRGWVSPTAPADALTVGRGYTVYLPGNETVRFVGALNNGSISQAVPRAATPAAETGYHLLGNPYPSPLDFSRLAIPAGLDNALYVFQSTGAYAGTYRAYVNGVGGTPEVALGQGFFVRANAGSNATLTFTNAARVTTFGPGQNFSRSAADPRPLVQLRLQGAAALPADNVFVYFEAGATSRRDGRFDADKLLNPGASVQLAAVSPADGAALAICGLPPLLGQPCTVPLTVAVPQPGPYTLQVAAFQNFAPTQPVYLRDALLGTRQALLPGGSYAFTMLSANAPNRFSLEFGPAVALATALGNPAAQAEIYPNPATDHFTVVLPPLGRASTPVVLTLLTSLGQPVRACTGRCAAAGFRAEIAVTGLAPGVYALRVEVAGQPPATKRVVVE